MPVLNETISLSEVLARLDSLTNWESRPRGAIRVGLEPMHDLMRRLGNPHKRFRAIHVAGTKGKGSVCALIEAGLLRAGWKVGRYSSPHIESVTERVNILGRPVGENELASALMRVLDCHEAAKRTDTPGTDATWFDVITAAAFLIFDEAHLDWAVIEVGIGGRLDSTNVVDAEVAVVTNIELEHTEVLGMSREAIAYEKVGILKPGAALATMLPTSDAAGRVLDDRANQLSCLVLRPDGEMDTISDANVALAGIVFDHLGRLGEAARADQHQGEAMGSWLLDRNTVDRARLAG